MIKQKLRLGTNSNKIVKEKKFNALKENKPKSKTLMKVAIKNKTINPKLAKTKKSN